MYAYLIFKCLRFCWYIAPDVCTVITLNLFWVERVAANLVFLFSNSKFLDMNLWDMHHQAVIHRYYICPFTSRNQNLHCMAQTYSLLEYQEDITENLIAVVSPVFCLSFLSGSRQNSFLPTAKIKTHGKYVTPEFEGKLECINYMCVRTKLHTRNDSVNIRYSAKA
jgi:hypothetical protein